MARIVPSMHVTRLRDYCYSDIIVGMRRDDKRNNYYFIRLSKYRKKFYIYMMEESELY